MEDKQVRKLCREAHNFGQCLQDQCAEAAGADGWCCEHSGQLKQFGTHMAVGPHGVPTEDPPPWHSEFDRELEKLINRYSIENESNTPDFLLASYLRDCPQHLEQARAEA